MLRKNGDKSSAVSGEMTNTGVRPFGLRDKISYALGDFGCNMSFVFINSYLMVFYVTCMGIPGKIYSVLILISKIWDAINDPIIGGICDSHRPKTGSKYLPWIKWGSIPLLVLTVALFIYVPNAPMWVKCTMCLGLYALWSVAYTAVNVPYGSLQNAITDDPVQRAELSNFRSIGAGLAQAPAMLLMPLIAFDKTTRNPRGSIFIYIVLVMGVIGFIAFYVMRKTTTERISYAQESPEKFNYFKTMKAYLTNKPMMGVTLATIAQTAFIMTSTTTIQYLFMCYFKNTELITIGTVISYVPMVLAMLFCKPLVKKFSKRQLCTYPFLVSIVAGVVLTFVKFKNPFAWFGVLACLMLATGTFTVLTWAMVADCIDYQQKKTGRNEESSIYATYSLFRKLAQGIGQAAVSLGVDLSGYVAAKGAEQGAVVAGKIYTMCGALPLVGAVICFVSMFLLYKGMDNIKLEKKTMNKRLEREEISE